VKRISDLLLTTGLSPGHALCSSLYLTLRTVSIIRVVAGIRAGHQKERLMKMSDAAPPRSILCIEKDASARAALVRALSDYDLLFTADAFETIRSMNARAFDAYIIDFWLPDWSGPQLCRSIRDLDPHCPIIFCTAADSDLSRQRALRAGASAYLCKPVSSVDLKTRVNALIAQVDTASLCAKAEMEHSVESEIARWEPRLSAALAEAKETICQSMERTARVRAQKAFLSSGGTRAHFERWWPHIFGSARANSAALSTSPG
jgi:DNA-binding response OmpR family regulator